MPLTAPPVDFNAMRVAVVAAICQATGLDDNAVIMAEPEQPNAPRPALPYVTLKFTTPLSPLAGTSDYSIDGNGTYTSRSQHSSTVSVNTYGPSHEGAYNLLGMIQAGLDAIPVRESLSVAGLAVWAMGAILDLSALLDTGYEGRAQMDLTLGVASNAEYDNVDFITSVPVNLQTTLQGDLVTGTIGA